jgi:hypothetical protein
MKYVYPLLIISILTACGGGGSDAVEIAATDAATKQTEDSATLIITSSSSMALVNSAVTISWESTNTNECIASGAWSGSKPTSGSQSFIVTSATSYNFILDCSPTDSIINNSLTSAYTSVSGYQGWDFVQRGLDLDGEAADDWSGESVALSSDGNVVAVGTPYNDGNGSNSGHTRVYAWQ